MGCFHIIVIWLVWCLQESIPDRQCMYINSFIYWISLFNVYLNGFSLTNLTNQQKWADRHHRKHIFSLVTMTSIHLCSVKHFFQVLEYPSEMHNRRMCRKNGNNGDGRGMDSSARQAAALGVARGLLRALWAWTAPAAAAAAGNYLCISNMSTI